MKKKEVKKTAQNGGGSVGGATAAAILGLSAVGKKKSDPAEDGLYGRIKVKVGWEKFYENLIELRERLLLQMSGLARDSAEEMSNYSLHMADSGTDNFDRDFALSLLSSDQDAVYEIEEALKRIENETYGVCEMSGKAIPKARLTAIPWTRYTVEAQAQLEKEGALRKRGLGALGSVDSAGSNGKPSAADMDDDDGKPSKKAE